MLSLSYLSLLEDRFLVSLRMKQLMILIFSFCVFQAGAQTNSIEAAYKRFPTLPPIQLLLGDSTTKFSKDDISKKKPVLVMLFSPECSHCQHTAEEMLKKKDEIKDIQIVMATMLGLTEMNEFVEKYKLNTLKNVVVGKDIYYLLPPFYDIKNLPFMAFYTKKGNLISVFEGAMPLDKVLQIFKEN